MARAATLLLSALLLSTTAASAHPLFLGGNGESIAVVRAATTAQPDSDGGGWLLLRGETSESLDLPSGAVPMHLSRVASPPAGGEGDGLLLISIVASETALGRSATERFDLRMQSADGQWRALPSPATDGLLVTPRPLLDAEGSLAQLLWIEGDDLRASSVRAVRWTGGGWGPSETISAVGPGTQTALDAVTLADGSALAVWAAFDGEDDEILQSRFDGRAWSRPANLTDNAVPDVTPTLRALPPRDGEGPGGTRGGALVAWSAFDGRDYRLRLARIEGSGNGRSEATWHGGPGSVSPYFARGAGADALVFLQTVPAAWVVSELSPGAEVLRSATTTEHVASPDRAARRPLVLATDEKGVELLWPAIRAEKRSTTGPEGAVRKLAWQ
jgi:hypothetical protein